MRIKQISTEISIWYRQVVHIKNVWTLLPGFCAVSLVYLVHHSNLPPQLTTRLSHEGFAPWLVFMVLVILLAKSLLSRDPLIIFLTVLAQVFLIRELNDTVFIIFDEEYLFKSKKLVDCLLVGMVLWAYCWHEKLFECLNRSIPLKVLLSGMLWTYLFSQLIARRVFRDILPDERLLHIPLEETAETAAHLFFLGCSLFCFFIYESQKIKRCKTTVASVDRENTVKSYQGILE